MFIIDYLLVGKHNNYIELPQRLPIEAGSNWIPNLLKPMFQMLKSRGKKSDLQTIEEKKHITSILNYNTNRLFTLKHNSS